MQQTLLGRISVIKINVLPRMLFLFQSMLIVTLDASFNQWQKDLSRFIWQCKTSCIKYKILQDAKERGMVLDYEIAFWHLIFGLDEGMINVEK